MAFLGVFLVGFLAMASHVQANGGGWINAHATFYGGGDASGTMGMLIKITSFYHFLLRKSACLVLN